MAKRPKYRMYVDEVGNPDLGSSDNFNHRFLSLTGVIMDLDYVKETFHPELEKLKTKYFNSHPDEPIIFHRKELLGCKPPFSALRDAKLRKQFDRELLKLLGNWDYTVITVCIDKKKHNETYSQWKHHPYHYCMELLLERYFFYLESISEIGDVLAESRGGKEDRKLKKSFSRLWNTGTSYIEASSIQNVLSSKQLKIKPKSNNISGLQLCDLLAHPSRNEILNKNGFKEINIKPFGAKIIKILKSKYYKDGNRIFGKKFI